MWQLDFHPLVEADLTESAEWYERQQPGLSERFLADVHETLRRLPSEALLYAVRFADIRRVNSRTFRHGVFYFITGEIAVILAVLHGARDSEAELQRRRETYG